MEATTLDDFLATLDLTMYQFALSEQGFNIDSIQKMSEAELVRECGIKPDHASAIVTALAERQRALAEAALKPKPRPAVGIEPKGVAGGAVFWLSILTCASVGMTIGNKAIMLQFPFANSLSMMQNGITALFLWFGFLANFVAINKMTAAQWQTFGVTAFLLATQIMSSLKSLPMVAIATVSAAGIFLNFYIVSPSLAFDCDSLRMLGRCISESGHSHCRYF
jgi:hypothetical protein